MNIPESFIDKFSEQMDDLFSQGKQSSQDLKNNLHALIQTQLSKLDVVTRDEFDTQQLVLEKTRTQIDQLEKQLSELMTKLQSFEDKK